MANKQPASVIILSNIKFCFRAASLKSKSTQSHVRNKVKKIPIKYENKRRQLIITEWDEALLKNHVTFEMLSLLPSGCEVKLKTQTCHKTTS